MRGGVVTGWTLMMVVSLAAGVVTVETAQAQSGPVATLQVNITGNTFSPPDIIVIKGSRVTWTNRDGTVHTVTNDGGSESVREFFAPASVSAAAVQDYTFNNLGVVRYFCEVHPSMRGSVTVVERFEEDLPLVPVSADDENQFRPRDVVLNVSQGITWTNVGANLHDVTFEDPSIGALGDLPAGGNLTFSFDAPGTYLYRCKYHSTGFDQGMVGRVAVGGDATLPVVIAILQPQEGSNVTGNVTVTGTLHPGIGQPEVTAVEVDVSGTGNWSRADGIDTWSFLWDSRQAPNGNVTIQVRAVANQTELALETLPVVVANEMAAPPSRENGSGASAPGFALVLLALLWAARRR